MEALRQDQTRFRIHGPDADRDELVSGLYFSNKLGSFIRALIAADKQMNEGERRHDYKIAKLRSSSPTVTLTETPLPKFETAILSESGVVGFRECASAIIAGDYDRARDYGDCAKHISKLASGAQKHFGYAEVWTTDKVIRVDQFLQEQSNAVINPQTELRTETTADWYKGVADGTFDGVIKAVDLRGALPEIKLILSAGGKQLDCVVKEDQIDAIRQNLDVRVRIFGRAIYDGKSGLPRRVEVREIEPMTGDSNFEAWRGAFDKFEPPEWDMDDG